MIRRLIALVMLAGVIHAAAPQAALAYPYRVERWRPTVRAELHRYGGWSRYRENKILHIIWRESGGNPRAGKRSSYFGLVQFGPSWSRGYRRDWRGNPQQAIAVMARGWCRYGDRWVMRHWRATFS